MFTRRKQKTKFVRIRGKLVMVNDSDMQNDNNIKASSSKLGTWSVGADGGLHVKVQKVKEKKNSFAAYVQRNNIRLIKVKVGQSQWKVELRMQQLEMMLAAALGVPVSVVEDRYDQNLDPRKSYKLREEIEFDESKIYKIDKTKLARIQLFNFYSKKIRLNSDFTRSMIKKPYVDYFGRTILADITEEEMTLNSSFVSAEKGLRETFGASKIGIRESFRASIITSKKDKENDFPPTEEKSTNPFSGFQIVNDQANHHMNDNKPVASSSDYINQMLSDAKKKLKGKVNYQCDSRRFSANSCHNNDDSDNRSFHSSKVCQVVIEKNSVRKKKRMSHMIKAVIDGTSFLDSDSDSDRSPGSLISINNSEEDESEDCPSLFSASSKDNSLADSFTDHYEDYEDDSTNSDDQDENINMEKVSSKAPILQSKPHEEAVEGKKTSLLGGTSFLNNNGVVVINITQFDFSTMNKPPSPSSPPLILFRQQPASDSMRVFQGKEMFMVQEEFRNLKSSLMSLPSRMPIPI